MINTHTHMLFLTPGCPVAVVTSSFWSVSGRKRHWAIFMEKWLEKKSDSLLCFFSFFRSHLDRKAHLTAFSVFFSFINEAFIFWVNPSITLTSTNIHKYGFKLLITINQTYFIRTLSFSYDYAQCFVVSASIICLNWAEAAHCGQSKRFLH